jgi:hypothetical protein
MDELSVLMAGRVAEELFTGTVTTGAQDDFKRATGLAKRMVLDWGMGEHFRNIAWGSDAGPIFLGEEIAKKKDHSEETARLIDPGHPGHPGRGLRQGPPGPPGAPRGHAQDRRRASKRGDHPRGEGPGHPEGNRPRPEEPGGLIPPHAGLRQHGGPGKRFLAVAFAAGGVLSKAQGGPPWPP